MRRTKIRFLWVLLSAGIVAMMYHSLGGAYAIHSLLGRGGSRRSFDSKS